MELRRTWEEKDSDNFLRTLVFAYDQLDNHIYNFRVYSDGFPGTQLSDYTALNPLKVKTWAQLMEIVPMDLLRDLILVDETEWMDSQ